MGKSNHIYNSLIAGEVSPRSFGRTDANFYNQAAEEIRNMIVLAQGGVMRRPGTLYKRVLTKTDGTAPEQVRLFPFKGSDGSFWQIIITDEDVNEVSATGTHINQLAWRAVNCGDGSIEEVFPITFDPVSEATSDFDWVPEPGWWDLGARGVDLGEIQYCQAGDTMFFAHGNCRPFRIVFSPSRVGTVHAWPPAIAVPSFGAHVPHTAFTMLGIPDARKFDDSSIYTVAVDYTCMRQMPYRNFRTDAVLTLVGISGTKGNADVVNCTIQIDLTNSSSDLVTFDETWIGRQMKFSKDASTFGVQITDYVSPTRLQGVALSSAAFDGKVLLDVVTNLAIAKTYGYGLGSPDDSSFEVGAWNDFDGWPRSVCFFESRLIFGGNTSFPDTNWASALDDVLRFDSRGFEQDPDFATPATTSGTAPFSQNMKEAVVTETRWLCSGKTIIAGTDAAEFVVEGPDQSKTIALDNTSSSPESNIGSARIQGIRYDNTTIFVQRDKKTLREMVFSLEENSFNAAPLSLLAEHIVNQFGLERDVEGYVGAALPGAIVALAKTDVPNSVIWCIDNNGCLLGLTRNRQQQIAAWHRHELSGGEGVITDGVSLAVGNGTIEYKPKILSMSAIRGAPTDSEAQTGEPDDLWFAVQRQRGTAVGSDPTDSTWEGVCTLEVMAREWERGTINRGWSNDPISAPIYLDCAIYHDSFEDGSTGIISIPYASVGDQITVLKDGYDLGEFTVDGSFQIDISARLTDDEIAMTEESDRWKAVCGYNYVARVIPLVSEVQMQTPGSSIGHVRRIDRITIYFVRSLGVRFGIKESLEEENTPLNSLEVVQFSLDPSDATAPTPLFTGEKQLDFSHGYERRPQVLIESYRPFPCTIPYVVVRQVVAED